MKNEHNIAIAYTKSETVATCKCGWQLKAARPMDEVAVVEFQKACLTHIGVPVKESK